MKLVRPEATPESGKRSSERWAGGFIRRDANGTATYYIRKMVRGERFELSTKRDNRSEAEEELRRFMRDPVGYASAAGEGDEDAQALYLDQHLRERFLSWSTKPEADGGKGNSPRWTKRLDNLLAWWAAHLVDERGRALDLRRVSRTKHVLPALDGVEEKGKPPAEWVRPPTGDKRHKREAIKTFYHWLWNPNDYITSGQDPVRDLPVGPPRAAATRKVVPKLHIENVIDGLHDKCSIYGHVLTVQADTGWHITELCRFAAAGDIEPVPAHLEQSGAVAVLVGPMHKSGAPHRTKVGTRAFASAKVMLDRYRDSNPDSLSLRRAGHYRGTGEEVGGFSISNYKKAIHAECDRLGIPRFSGAWMRHTNYELARDLGHTVAEASAAIHHAPGSDMGPKHYARSPIVPKLRTVLDDAPPGPVAAAVPAKPRRKR